MLKRIHAVGALFENEAGEILILKRSNQGAEANTWGLVGGKVDPGETGLVALIREIKEEIGLDMPVSTTDFVKTYTWDRQDITLVFGLYRISINQSSIGDIKLDKDENVEFEWVIPNVASKRNNLMIGLYEILKDVYQINI